MADGGTVTSNGTGDRMVMISVNLGWQMAELYQLVRPAQLEPPEQAIDGATMNTPPAVVKESRAKLDDDLPGASGLTSDQQLRLKFEQVSVWVGQLRPRISAAGLEAPDNSEWSDLASRRRSAEGRYQLAAAIRQFHGDMLTRLTATDYQLGRAYGLGRALADLSLRPRATSRESFTDDLRFGRVQTISSWLGELHTVLPDHAAGAVMGSIAQWQAWAAEPQWEGVTRPGQDHVASAVEMLRGQGRQWRSLLTGQVKPLDELAPEDYVDAADYLIGRIRNILERLLVQYWPAVLAGILIMAAAVIGAFFAFKTPVGKSAGAAVSFLAWLGITGKFVSAGLQRAVGQVEDSLWQGELDLAVARAITKLPGGAGGMTLGEPARTWPRFARAIGLGRRKTTAESQARSASGLVNAPTGTPAAGRPP